MTKRFVVDFGSTGRPRAADGRLDAPAFHRNHAPIWSAIGPWLSAQHGDALELASGTGQHVAEFARKTPTLTWWPSDINDAHLDSVRAWRAAAGVSNLRDPQRIDLTNADWVVAGPPKGALAAMVAVNLLHISPWPVSQNLIAGAAQWLRAGAKLFVYGPFLRDGEHTAPSNATFDASLRADNPKWGVRDMSVLAKHGAAAGLPMTDIIPMPANNFILAFTRPAP